MRKRMTVSLFAVLLSMVLAACGSSSKESAAAPAEDWNYAVEEEAAAEMAYDSYYGEEAIEPEMGDAGNGTETPEVNESATSQRKLIKTVDLSVETKDYDGLMVSLEKRIEELGGYIESLGAYNGSYYSGRTNRSANITARIPADKLDGFVKQIGEEANVVDRNESVEDVTLQYVDLDSHARMLEEEQERLLELLENAQTIEDIITIESRLSEVKYQLESMKSQLRTFDNKVTYSTVHIYIDEVKELTPVVEQTAGERIAEGFMESIRDIGEGFKEFFIGLVINIPYIIVWAVIIAVIAFVVLKIVKLIDKRSARKWEETQKNGVVKSLYVQRPATRTSDAAQKDATVAKNVTENKTEENKTE